LLDKSAAFRHAMAMKTILITGATDGIGKETARALVAQGHTVTLIARDAAKGADVQRELGGQTRFVACDLASAASIDRAAEQILASHPRIDVLVNNAGGVFAKRQENPDGVEMTFGLNHMAYARMTARLLPRLKQSAPARIVCVASRLHTSGRLDFADLEFKTRRYNGIQAYADSKLANVLFSNALARRLAGSNVTANSLHPGFVASRFGRNNKGLFGFFAQFTPLMGAITPQMGALTSIHLASSASVDAVSGQYFSESRATRPLAAAEDVCLQDQLWAETERRLGFAIV
jgi:NAD(P)-dependent dehydrogenase (short-subunit alcohol dehydrogenase family)